MSFRRPSTPQHLPVAEQFILSKGLWDEYKAFRALRRQTRVALAKTKYYDQRDPRRITAEERAEAAQVSRLYTRRYDAPPFNTPRGCSGCAWQHKPKEAGDPWAEWNCGHGCHRVAARA